MPNVGGKPISAKSLQCTNKPTEIHVNNVNSILKNNSSQNNQKTQFTSGGKPQKIDKLYLKDYNAIPGLAHIDITLSSTEETHQEAKTHVRALHDSGCAKTIISKKVFDRLT